MDKKQQEQPRIRLNFANMDAQYVSEFSVQATDNEVFLNLAASLLPGMQQGEFILPVHTRVAMNYQTSKKLMEVLQSIVTRYERDNGNINAEVDKQTPQDAGTSKTATLPKITLNS